MQSLKGQNARVYLVLIGVTVQYRQWKHKHNEEDEFTGFMTESFANIYY